MTAVYREYGEAMPTLGAEVTDQDIEGLRWLFRACTLGNHEVASQVLTIKPSIRQASHPQSKLTPLLGALAYYKEGCPQDLFCQLVQAPTDLNAQQTQGWGAIHFLARQHRTDLLAIFLNRPGVNINLLTDKGESALMLAAWDGYDDVVKILLDHGADPTLPNRLGQLPIHKACIEAHQNCVTQLLKKIPSTKMATDLEGRTPAHYLAQTKSTNNIAIAAITALFSNTDLAKECLDDVTPLEMARFFKTEAAEHMAPKQILSLFQQCQNALCQSLDKATFEEVLTMLPEHLQDTLAKKRSRITH